MPREAARRDQHHVETRRKAGEIGARAKKMHEGARDPTPLSRRHGLACCREIVASLHFDGGQDAAATGKEIDLPHRRAIPSRDDAISLEPQLPQAEEFGAVAAPERRTPALATHPPRPASANAR
jgi:hypothetical protein